MIDPRLIRLLGKDSLASLRKRLRRQFERAAAYDEIKEFRLTRISREERDALASLMGRPMSRGKSIVVHVAIADAALREAGIAASLRQALELLDGPIANRAEAQARWSAIASGSRHPHLSTFLHTPAGLGLLKRVSQQDQTSATAIRDGADTVLERLPGGGLPRAQLAAEVLGDAHALDGGRPVATLVLAAWRHVEARLLARDDDEQRKGERARETWARAGVLVNELAKPALFLNLPTEGGGGYLGKLGEPAYASLRLLLRSPPAWAVTGRTVYICENPNLVAIAADALGSRCASLVCTEGMPAAAQRTLLTQLAKAGARLQYHGDFDWPGIRIANHVMQIPGVGPWRFCAADYQAALSLVPRRRHKLADAPVPALWDQSLAIAMQAHAVAIPEESLAASLLQDLSEAPAA